MGDNNTKVARSKEQVIVNYGTDEREREREKQGVIPYTWERDVEYWKIVGKQRNRENITQRIHSQSHSPSLFEGTRRRCHSRLSKSVSFKNLCSAFVAFSCNIFCRHLRMASAGIDLLSKCARADARDCLWTLCIQESRTTIEIAKESC